MEKPNGTKVANDLLDMLNVLGSSGKDEQAFVDTIMRSHRTLQQSTCKLLLGVFEGWSAMKANGQYDLRNEATVNVAQSVSAAAEGSYMPLV